MKKKIGPRNSYSLCGRGDASQPQSLQTAQV